MPPELLTWLFQQGPTVVVIILATLGYFYRIEPKFERIQTRHEAELGRLHEKHEAELQRQIVEHRQRADSERTAFLLAIKELTVSHETALKDVAHEMRVLSEFVRVKEVMTH